MLKEIFFAVPDGRLRLYDLLPLGTGGTLVRATAARIASHAYAMPPATRPAVTQASQTPFGCRVHAGQVHSAEHHHDGGLLAGRVAVERGYGLSFFKSSLVEYLYPLKPAHIVVIALFISLAWVGRK